MTENTANNETIQQKTSKSKNISKSNKDKDRALKIFFGNQQNFADTVNAILFDGKPIVKPKDLQDGFIDNQYSNSDKSENSPKLKESLRDVCKLWTVLNKSINIAYLSFENQSTDNKYILPRIMKYDAENLEKQVLLKNGSITQPITIVLYTGNKKWDCITSVNELCGNDKKLKGIPLKYREDVKKIFYDYHFYFFSINDLTEEKLAHFQHDAKLAFTYFMRYSSKECSNNTHLLEIEQYIQNREALIPVLDAFSTDGEIWSNACENLKDKENITMCDVVKEITQIAVKEAEDKIIAKKDEEIATVITKKDEELAKKDAEIAALKAMLEQSQKQ